MKYMKLGSKPDIFQNHGNVTLVVTDLSSDVSVDVNGSRFLLHKFPLLSKSGRLHKLMAEAREAERDDIHLPDFPGGAETFELCAKFCYGIIVTLNAYNVIAVRCGAEYLEMSESIEKGNMIFKLEVFLNSSIFRSWKDSIIALKTTKALLPWTEDLKIVSRCIESIASKATVDPAKVDWSYTYTRDEISDEADTDTHSTQWNGSHSYRHHHHRRHTVPKDWWIEDLCELEIELLWRVVLAIKQKGKLRPQLIGDTIRMYAFRWLPQFASSKDQDQDQNQNQNDAARNRMIIETLVSLLPAGKGCTSCSFLLKMLKAATVVNAGNSVKMELAKRIGMQLEEASVADLLIPSSTAQNRRDGHDSDGDGDGNGNGNEGGDGGTIYDVDLVQRILEHYLLQDQSPSVSPNSSSSSKGRIIAHERRRTRSAENLEYSESRRSTSAATHSSKLKVAKLVDGYLAEIARDPNLSLTKFITLAQSVPDFARPVHDAVYRAIDIYLKEHSELTKAERKKLCRLMDCKKLSMDACMHAAQNERLPLRVVVQVLFFEQVRAAMSGGFMLNDLPKNIKALLPHQQQEEEDDDGDGHDDDDDDEDAVVDDDDDKVAIAAASNNKSKKMMTKKKKKKKKKKSEREEEDDDDDDEENWNAVHHDFKALKGDLANMKQRIAEAERERSEIQQQDKHQISQRKQNQTQQQHQLQQTQTLSQQEEEKSKGLKKMLRKIFKSKVKTGNSETSTTKSSEESRSSENSPISVSLSTTTTAAGGKMMSVTAPPRPTHLLLS